MLQLREITTKEYKDEISKEQGLYVLVFHALWCPPCKMFKHTLEEVVSKNNVPVYRVDVDANQDLTDEFGVTSMPTWFIFKDGKQVQKGLGYMPHPTFELELKKHM
ncbi:thioredoxin family protein [Mycoplasmopsis columbina]|uniref:thioredoxin family protein n=1 Tax=Mycoplasmopsis columbina TaxID=114881 RepID=UPI0004A747B0|nr:thioredoxin family protein [Mycoplasmopsis columbina]VEU77082.1 Thioredoxin [Mycoplasmopsis columbina]